MEYTFEDYTGDTIIVEEQGTTQSLLVTFVDGIGDEMEMCFDSSNIKDLEKMLEMLKEVSK